jgi:hypothetical protein
MSSYPPPSPCPHFEQALAPFLMDDGLPFAEVLPAAAVAQAFADEGVTFGAAPRSVFTPAVTLGAFLSQVLHANKSCRAAVLRVAVWLLALGRRPCALDTAAYRASAYFWIILAIWEDLRLGLIDRKSFSVWQPVGELTEDQPWRSFPERQWTKSSLISTSWRTRVPPSIDSTR